jgi:hypothetical protein
LDRRAAAQWRDRLDAAEQGGARLVGEGGDVDGAKPALEGGEPERVDLKVKIWGVTEGSV